MFQHPLTSVICTLCVALFCTTSVLSAESADSLHVRELNVLEVNADRDHVVRATLPVQVYSIKTIKTLNATNVADVAKFFSGVNVKDYGGVGGLKTMSIRGLGTCFTAVVYDGIALSNAQSGQIDLGQFSIENVGEIMFSNGQPDDIYQPARTFSSAGVLSINTKFLPFDSNRSFDAKVSVRTGSFGLLSPAVFLAKNFRKRLAISFSADGLMANGKYKFEQKYGSEAAISEVLLRENTDVKAFRTEMNTELSLKKNESIHFKMNYYNSERGLPGSVTFYKPDKSNQRLSDRNFFVQTLYDNKISTHIFHKYAFRYNTISNTYSDKGSKYQGGVLNESFLQNEYYLTSALKYTISKNISASAAGDWSFTNLFVHSNIGFKGFNYPSRQTGLVNIASKYVNDRLSASANLLYTFTVEKVKSGTSPANKAKLSPVVSLSYQLLSNKDLRLRAFYKNIYRLPSFNDLYYQDIGNINLRPEDANLVNVGCTFAQKRIFVFSQFEFTADAYYNNIANKIIAIPRDLFHWSMINKGNVAISGLDVSMRTAVKLADKKQLRLMANYGFQHAVDKTSGSENYNEQIPYTPLHSGSAAVSYEHRFYEMGYNLQFAGERWMGQITQPSNRLKGYATHSVFANLRFKKWELKAEIDNIFNTQYEIVKFFPMPRRNFRTTVVLNL
ncbi:MAG: TonB-dependent receptor plug domain-containing protein [Paludibacter sp.]